MKKKILCEALSNDDHDVMDHIAGNGQRDLLEHARSFATIAHEGQIRKDGKNPYIVHPERVVKILQNAGVVDKEVLAAAYLHDVLEDTKADISEFPERVQKLVRELTKPPGTKDKNAYIAGFSGKSLDAVLIKLADRYDNLLDGSKTMKPEWVKNYLQGAEALLLASRKAGINQIGPGARLYGQLAALRDRLSQASAQ
jgi:(p)ppGpp synthase/HD superfamily hydrolase